MNSSATPFARRSAAGQGNAVSDGPVLKPLRYPMHKEWTPVPATGISALN